MAINTTITNVSEFLDHIVASTNMRCATPRSALEGECGFLAANLYAKSVFGEDALVNVSVEKQPDGKLAGYIRIRYSNFCSTCWFWSSKKSGHYSGRYLLRSATAVKMQ